VTRDTLTNEPVDHFPDNENLLTPSSSTKRIPAPPIVSAVPPPIPVRNHVNDNTTVMNNHNEKSRKQSDQPPELPPKSIRALAAAGKMASPINPNLPIGKTNPIVNKENHNVATGESEVTSPSHEGKLVQRHKSKNARRRMTEEEAIKELG
jgi:hypothetical protein